MRASPRNGAGEMLKGKIFRFYCVVNARNVRSGNIFRAMMSNRPWVALIAKSSLRGAVQQKLDVRISDIRISGIYSWSEA